MGSTVNNGNDVFKSENGHDKEENLESLLKLDKIHVKDAKKVEALIEELINSGPEALQVIIDFDATLSAYVIDGKRCDTSYGLITNSQFTSPDVRAKAADLYAKYYPYETNMTVSPEERIEKLAEWYHMKHENYLKSSVKIKQSDIADLVRKANMHLRDGSPQVLKKLHDAGVPSLIFSAGNGNSIEEILKQNEINFDSIMVMSNFMEFDETTGEIIGFKKPVIHPGNKNKAAIDGSFSSYFEKLKSRCNAIVLGDNIGDADMANGLANSKTILKIGYINYKVDEQLDAFKNVFDVVLVEDQTFHFVAALVNLILSKVESD